MAQVRSTGREAVYNIKRWLGVNEAQEGDASLRFGEAAVCRNFRVTAGGALPKRPRCPYEAGQMTAYNAEDVPGEGQVRLVTEGLMREGLPLYPRITTDSVGNVVPDGEPVTASPEDAGASVGRYAVVDGAVRRLAGVSVTAAPGQHVPGGAVTPGALTRFAAGSADDLEGQEQSRGEQEVQVWPALSCVEGVFSLSGEPVTVGRAEGNSVGFATADVGGYLEREGRLWLYYGAKVDSVEMGRRWSKFRCVETPHTSWYSYYSQGSWATESSGAWEATDSYWETFNGYSSYGFNSDNGTYHTSGSYVNLYKGASGTAYQASGGTLTRCVSSGNTRTIASRSASGPYSGSSTSYTYSRGTAAGEVLVPAGQRPEAASMSYVTSFSEGGVSYTVMRDAAGACWCYCPGAESAAFTVRTYGWYGYPLTAAADVCRWRFTDTRSVPNDSADSRVRGIWAGFVEGREVLCAACNGHLWELEQGEGGWAKTSCGLLDTDRDVHMFGFDEKLYILNGEEYLVWDGVLLRAVEGYRPMVTVSAAPAGGGTELERVNLLTGARRCRFSPDGSAKVFQLPETQIDSLDWVKDLTTGQIVAGVTADLSAGTVTFPTAPTKGVNTVEIAWTKGAGQRREVTRMRYAELFNGAQDTRVFLYGDGSNRALYSGLDYDGKPRADYFPALNEAAVGDGNTPITAMIRHYDRLLCFKPDSAWSIYYNTITLPEGTVTAGFYVAPVNRSVGCCAMGQACLVENQPRTLDGRSVIEWRAASGGNVTGDERNAQRVSQRVDRTIRSFELASARTFYDKITHEYYVIGAGGVSLVHNVQADAWYTYTGFNAACLINYKDEVYYGTVDGYLRHFSTDYLSDQGEAIDACWESGAIDFGADFRRKYSAMLWIGIRPEASGYLSVTAETDRRAALAERSFTTSDAAAVPTMARVKLKGKRFTYYKLILRSDRADATATVVSADLRVRPGGYVR